MALRFPEIDPVAVALGPISIRWYALAYIAGLLIGWQYVKWLTRRGYSQLTALQVDDFLVWATVGVVLGGRLGYILFYRPDILVDDPIAVLKVWQGGMSFHGGMLGVIIAFFAYARRQGISVFDISDPVSAATPIGLFFGRIANFINGELFGRTSDAPWAMIFPAGGPDPRHPSQLYQAGLEGLLLFTVMTISLVRWRSDRYRGLLTGIFLAGYGITRLVGELFRQPDSHIGFVGGIVTMGQILSVPMVAFGIWLVLRARRDPR